MSNIELNTLQTGDVVLFSSNKWYSDIIKVGDDCVYSHCGIILKDPVFIDPSLKGVYLLESGMEPFPDVVDHLCHFGVQIVPLIKVINEYVIQKEGSIFHRPLRCKRDKLFEENLLRVYLTVKDKPYNCDPFDWIEALLNIHLFDRKITSRFWCSALVAYIYVQLGIIQNNIDWSLVTPKEWSSSCKCKFIFSENYSLDNEIKLI